MDEAKIEDPKVFTQPWTVAFYAFARAPKDYVPVEYACLEGNYALLHPSNERGSGVAFFAHVGGFIFGAIVARILLAAGRITPTETQRAAYR